MPRALSVIVAACCLVPATPVTAASASLGATALTWERCGSAECARLEVPLDDANPSGPTIELALTRVPARHEQRRIGALVVNPGGPGVPGADFARDLADALPRTLRNRFDVVGFDPRGSGESEPVDCTDDLDFYYDLDFTPGDPAERDRLLAGVSRLADECGENAGMVLPFLSSARIAADLDRIRAALGEERLTYLGYSYGTLLGALYADRFPDRVGAMVLDGAIDPSLDAEAQQVEQAVGFERALRRFLVACARDDECQFHRGGRTGHAYDRLRARVDRHPVPAPGIGSARVLNGTRFDLGIAQALYLGRVAWPELAGALDAAADGDGTRILELADLYTGRIGAGAYDNLQESFYATSCLDSATPDGVAGIEAIEEQARRVAPRLGAAIVNNSLVCAFWPVPPAPPIGVPRAEGAPPILVIGTRADPATPFAWAKGLARSLSSGVLLRVGGERHTAFASGNGCVDRVVLRYLVDGATSPAARC